MITIHAPESSYPVYCNPCWWSDSWEPLDFGQELDFSRGFVEQFKALWKERERRKYEVASIEVPDHICDVNDNILGQVLGCKACGSGYKITLLELKFYRKIDAPVPRFCPQCRKIERFARSGSYELWDRHCAECDTPFRTPYHPEDPARVLCEECYLSFLYQ